MILLGALGIAMVYLFMPKGFVRLNSRMFFLGTAFMLLETKAVVQVALLFGSTWLVNSAVFFTAWVLILLANLYVFKSRGTRLSLLGTAARVIGFSLCTIRGFSQRGSFWRYIVPACLRSDRCSSRG
jgi:hypothetical protein